jgi:hypothetical protein
MVRIMEINIDNNRSFQNVQYEFNDRYPFLKIDFLRPYIGERSLILRRQRIPGTINIEGKRTVDQVVNDFGEIFGFCMIVLRRSGNVWIETSLTSDWSLEQQNREGESISRIT